MITGPLNDWEKEHGIGNVHYGWARHRKQRMQPVTDASQLSSYHSAYQFPQLRLGGGVSNDYQTLKDGTMLARASSKIKLTRATMVSSLKKLIVSEVSSSMLHTVLRTNNGTIMSFGVGRSGQLGHGNNLDVDSPKSKYLNNIYFKSDTKEYPKRDQLTLSTIPQRY